MQKNKVKIPVAEPDLSGKEAQYVLDAIKNEGRISSSGKYIERFENFGRQHFKREYAVSCSNGTAALHLALLSLGVKAGDEIIVPVFTFASVAASVLHCLAKPVFVDISRENWTINIDELDKNLTTKTKGVIAVDSYGMPCNYDFLVKWCKKNKLFLIEDAAEAHGALWRSQPVGSFGDISCFSFYGNKIITTGEGGMCLTNSEKLYKKMAIFKNHGRCATGIYDFEVVGYNYRLTNIQAAIGCAQFERMNEFLSKRERINAWYHKYLGDIKEISFQKFDPQKIQPVCWLFSCLVKKDNKMILSALAEKGVENRPFFMPLHLQKPYKKYCAGQKFPVAEHLWKYGLTLPTSVKLKEKEIKYVCDCLRKILK